MSRGETGARPPRRRRLVLAVAAVVTVAGGGAAVTVLANPDSRDTVPAGSPGLSSTTASVTRVDLSDSTRRDGTLGHLGERRINAGAAAGGGAGGTLTWLAPTGSVVKRNERVYEIDGRAVRLMYGAEPMYRTLKTGAKGKDVRQWEENLAALGYTGFDVDEEYTAKTAAAVERWQKSHDLRRTGTVGPDQIAFAGSAVRVKETGAGSGGDRIAVGDRITPGSPVLTVTGSERVVGFRIPAAEAGSARAGTRAHVTLPDGTRLPGKVSAVGRTATVGDDPQDKTPKIDITVSFDDPDKVTGVDQSPVTVELTGETRKDVLSVPVNALLALPDGGFGVQVVENGRARDVEVELGMFGQGRVEVSGEGLREGMKVGVPSA
ncbi:peptidoglycan-binding protein [Streptomyces sp. NPDC006798]|uniref:peptidoglycan-binding protein n=1 Tax=Streptomyces sp. NPDC006798 TaxID=3155462 RepID=UPI0033D38924